MKKWSPTQEAFDCLLAWLDPDRELAGRKYEEVRVKLTRLFARRGCSIAEELADEVIDRVARKCSEIAHTYVGDPVLYFCGVAHNVFLEHVKKRHDPLPLPPPEPSDEKERYSNCLDACIEQLDHATRDLILEYYRDERRAKIDHRKELAERLGITLNTLRMRAHRIKKTLEQCLSTCLHRQES